MGTTLMVPSTSRMAISTSSTKAHAVLPQGHHHLVLLQTLAAQVVAHKAAVVDEQSGAAGKASTRPGHLSRGD